MAVRKAVTALCTPTNTMEAAYRYCFVFAVTFALHFKILHSLYQSTVQMMLRRASIYVVLASFVLILSVSLQLVLKLIEFCCMLKECPCLVDEEFMTLLQSVSVTPVSSLLLHNVSEGAEFHSGDTLLHDCSSW